VASVDDKRAAYHAVPFSLEALDPAPRSTHHVVGMSRIALLVLAAVVVVPVALPVAVVGCKSTPPSPAPSSSTSSSFYG
jgi:hypothetical protein